MIRHILLASVAALAMVSTGAQAQCSCSTQQVTNGSGGGNQNLTGALSGNTVCVGNAGAWNNQELHVSGGSLVDYKKGPSDPVDPSKQIGTWAVSGTGTASAVTYSYQGGGTYAYNVCTTKSNGKPGVGDPIGFCPSGSANSTVNATIKSAGAC